MAANAILPQPQRFEQESMAPLKGAHTSQREIPQSPLGDQSDLLTWLGEEEIPRKGPVRQAANFGVGQARDLINGALAGMKEEIYDLKKYYMFRDRGIDNFLQSHDALISVLKKAVIPLREAFGADVVCRLELRTEEDGSRMIYAAALCRGSVREAARAFDQFVDRWWLDHMTNQTSDLAFVYRIWR